MSEKRRRKMLMANDEPPTKEELAVADFLRFNVPSKEGKYSKLPVHYFIGCKAVDKLMESKWESKNCKKGTPLFTGRGGCVEYCRRLMCKDLFYRARKAEKTKDPKKKKDKKEEASKDEKGKKDKKGEEQETSGKSKKEDEKTEKKEEATDGKQGEKTEKKEKKKKPTKLEDHEDQRFLDGEEIYIWIHDPTPLKNKIIGLLLVLGAIAICLFPLWPMEVRQGTYYISLAAAAFVVFILSLCLIRFVTFCLVWLSTMGRYHFWLLPNLTEDVGFFDSFRPLYTSSYKGEEDATAAATETSSKSSQAMQEGGAAGNESEGDSEGELEFEMIDPTDSKTKWSEGNTEEGSVAEGEEQDGEDTASMETGSESGVGEADDDESKKTK